MLLITTNRTVGLSTGLIIILIFLSVLTVWRLAFHVYAKSHSRRMLFHMQLLIVILLELPFWTCESLKNGGKEAFAFSLILHLLSESMHFVSITLTIYFWTDVLSAGVLSSDTTITSKKWKPLHFLFALNLFQILYSLLICIFILSSGAMERLEIYAYLKTSFSFASLQWVYFITQIVLLISVLRVGIQLQCRLITFEIDEYLKAKSLIQINLATFTIVLTLFLQMIITFPTLWNGLQAWGSLDFTDFRAFGYSLPCMANCFCFLYFLRRKEGRNVDRTIIIAPSQELLTPQGIDYQVKFFESFATPCSYCSSPAHLSPVRNTESTFTSEETPQQYIPECFVGETTESYEKAKS